MFDYNYDKSLGLMLESSKDKRKMIVNFLKNIPLELLNQLYKSFDEFKEYYDNPEVVWKNIKFSDKFITKGDMVYWYNIDPITESLQIGESVRCLGEEISIFQLILYPLYEKDYNSMKSLDKSFLGEIWYNFTEEIIDEKIISVDCDLTDFTLIKFPLRDIVDEHNYYVNNRSKYNFVNIANVPDIVNINKFDENEGNLVRVRRKLKF